MAELYRRCYPHLKEELYTAILDNGMHLYIIPKKGFVEKVAFLSTHFGSVDGIVNDEGQCGPSGIAHFLEHKLFEDAEEKDVSLDFVNLGAEVNAFTTLERTTYYFSTLDNFEEALTLLQTFTAKLTTTSESVEREKNIIEQEIKMYFDDPEYRAYLGCLQSLYPNTALAKDIAGSLEDVTKIQLDDLKEQFERFYQPSNRQLVLVGDFDIEDVYNSVKETQARLTPSLKTVPKETKPLLVKVEKKEGIQMDVVTAKLALGFKSRPYSSSRMREQLLTQLFFNLLFGWTSPFYQKWYAEGKIDETLSMDFEISSRFAFVILTMDTAEPIRMSSLIRQVMTSSDKKKLFTEEALTLQKNALYGDFLRSFDNIHLIGSQFVAFQGENETYFDLGKELMNISLSEVKDFAKHYVSHMETSDFVVFPK